MADPNSDLASKINRAVKALIIAEGAGSATDTFAAPCSEDRAFPNTTVNCGDGHPFDGPGNLEFPNVNLNLRDEAGTQPTETNPAATRVTANQRLTNILNALTRSDDTHTLDYTAQRLTTLGRALSVAVDSSAAAIQFAADNADMAEFTVLRWDFPSIGAAQKSGGDGATFWERDLQFGCVACNVAL